MTTDHRGMMEGLGGPIRMDGYQFDGIDPALDDCCRREVESNRRHNAMTATLRRHDVVALAERRRRNLVTTPAFTGCRCCYDPNSDGGEYRALIEFRAMRGTTSSTTVNQNEQEDKQDEKKLESAEERQKRERNSCVVDSDEDEDDDEFDYLLDEDLPQDVNDGINALEENRRAELELAVLSREVALQHGYGTHRQLHPSRVLKAAGLGDRGIVRDPPSAVVLHLVDPDSMASASLDWYLEEVLAKQYAGTIFVRSGGRSTLLMDADLSSKAFPQSTLEPDRDMPALIAIRNGTVVNTAPMLRGLVDDRGSGQIIDHVVHDWLSRCGVLISQAPPMEALCYIRPEEEALMDYLATLVPTKEDAIEQRFNCGLADCNKSFPHEHVGIPTSEQDGLLVSEAEVVGEGPGI